MDPQEDSPSDSGSDGPHSPTVAAATAASPPSPPPSSSSTSNNHGSESASEESAGLASSGGGSGAGAGAGAGASVVGAHSLWTQCETANDDQDGESRQPEAPPSSDGASFRSTPSPTTRAENAAAQRPQTVEEALRKGSAFDCPNCRRLVVRRDDAHVLAFTGRCPKQSADTMCACCVRRMVQRGLNAWHPAHPDAQFIMDLISDRPGCPVCHSGPPAGQEQAAPYTREEMRKVLVGNRQCCCACCVDARSTPDDSATYRKWWPLCLAADARRHNVSVTPLPGTPVDPRGADTSSGAGAGAGTGAGAAARPSSTTASVAPTTGSNTNTQLTLLAAADGSAGPHYGRSKRGRKLFIQLKRHALLLRELQERPHAIVRKCTRCDKLCLIKARCDPVTFHCGIARVIMCRHCDHMVESPLDDGFAKDADPILADHKLNVCPVTRGQRLVALSNVAWSTWDNGADVRAKVDTVHKYLQWVKNRMLQPPCPHCGRLLPMTLTDGTFDVVCVCGQNVCLLCQTRLSSLAPDVVAGHAATASMRNLPTLEASTTHFANPSTEWRVRNPANRSCPHMCSELGDYFPQALSSHAPAPGLDDHIMQLQVESLSPDVTAGVYQLSHVRRLDLLALLLGGHHGTGALPRSLLAAVHAYDVEVHGGALFSFWPEGEFPELPVHDVMYILWKQGRADRCGQFGQPAETTQEEGTDSWTMLPSGPDGPHGDIFFYASDYTGNGSYGVVDVVTDSSDPFTDEGAAALAMQIG